MNVLAGLTSLDYALVGVLALSALVGLLRGLFREVMSLAVWIAALWVAGRHAGWLAPHLADWVPNAALRLWAARLAVFIGVLVAGGILTWLLAMAVHGSRLSAPDRMAGMVFGLARGVLLVAITSLLLGLSGFSDEPWWRQSKLIPYAAPVADALREAAEHGLGRP